MSKPIIEVQNLAKRYQLGAIGATSLRESFNRWWENKWKLNTVPEERDFWALREVSFSVNQGEVVGIVGRNGAGKSTLLKLLSRITEPTSGRALLRGRVASLLEVGTGFHPELSGRENIFLNGAILGMTRKEIRRKFDEIVAFAEVDKFIDTPVKRYSSGMYVRLAFAIAAHLEPEILIVDEVLAVGDSRFQEKCLGKMKSITGTEGRTVVFVSHNMAAVQRLCQRTVVLDGGHTTFIGATDDAVEKYLGLAASERSVEADGNVELKGQLQTSTGAMHFLRARVFDNDGKPVNFGTIGQSLIIEVEFELTRRISSLIVGLAIHDSLGEALFATHWNDQGRTYELKEGRWRARCNFKPNYLRAGSYRVSLGAVTASETCAHVPEAFLLRIESVMSRETKHYDDRIGRLFIPMQWDEPAEIV